MTTEYWAIGLVVIASMIGAVGALFLKKGSPKFRISISGVLRNKYLLIGVVLYALSTILFIPALRGGDLSVLYPLVSLAYVWIALLSIKFLDEKMNKSKWLGITLIIIGVSLVGIGS